MIVAVRFIAQMLERVYEVGIARAYWLPRGGIMR